MTAEHIEVLRNLLQEWEDIGWNPKEVESLRALLHYYVPDMELNPTMPDPRDEGCLCSGCGKRYKVDINVPDDLWQLIEPVNVLSGKPGLLCGACIASRIEALGEFDALELTLEATE